MRAERSGEPHLARRVRPVAHPGALGRDRPGRGLHRLARVRVAYHAPRAVGCGGALPWRRPGGRAPRGRPAVLQVPLRDADDYAHASAQHGRDLHAHRSRDRAVRAPVRAVETTPHRRAVRGAAGVVLRHVADAVRRWAIRLAARGVERAAGGHILPSVVPHPQGGRPIGRGHIMNVAPGPGFSLGTGADRDGGPGECRGAACCAPTMRRRDFLGACGIGLAGIFVRRWPAHGDVLVERWSWAMGQAVHLMVYAESEQSGLDACGAALAELRRVEARLTLFDDASDLCELNRRAGKRAMVVDRDLAAVLALAEGFRRATGGAFNVAVEPLMRAWGFHRPRTPAPSASALAEARAAGAPARGQLPRDPAPPARAHTPAPLR